MDDIKSKVALLNAKKSSKKISEQAKVISLLQKEVDELTLRVEENEAFEQRILALENLTQGYASHTHSYEDSTTEATNQKQTQGVSQWL